MPNRVGKNRLLKLADLLEADAKNKKGIKFDLRDWGHTDDQWTTPLSVSCGTTACAVGLAVVSGAFKRSGLYNRSDLPGEIVPGVGDLEGFEAVESFFNLTEEEAGFLFSDIYYPIGRIKGAKGERFVAKRIRGFVAGRYNPRERPTPWQSVWTTPRI
jgi:hypothetical protein